MLSNLRTKLASLPWLAEVVTLLGGVLFAMQTWVYIRTQVSILDEGNYLYKGLLFVRGQYEIFQDYGPWSNHMPLSFLIPGYVQHWFGPSLRTGRYLAFILGLLTLLGVWLVARRWGGRWWGTFAVWALALNAVILKIYSVMSSQVLIACMLAWVLVLVLAEQRKLWQILLGSALAGVILLTRLNLAPLLPLLLLYIFWQFGKRAALWATLVMGIVVLLGHALFWPGILRMWATWIPTEIAPFLAPFLPPEGISNWNPQVNLTGRLISFLWGLRYHFVAVLGVLATLILWPRKTDWRSSGQMRASVFLVVLFLALFMAHAWVTVAGTGESNEAYSSSYCVFCFPVYLAFFSFVGILLIVIAAPSWRRVTPWWLSVIIAVCILALTAGIGFSTFWNFGEIMAKWRVPRAKGGRLIFPGTVKLWEYVELSLGYSYKQSLRLLPTWAGASVGVFSLLIASLVTLWMRIKRKTQRFSFGYLALMTMLVVGFLLSPTEALGGGYHDYDCTGDVLAAYDAVGQHLLDKIPPGSSIYWKGGLSPAALLYLEDIRIFPAQLNGAYTYMETGTTEALVKYGFWNSELAQKWMRTADVILIEAGRFQNVGYVVTSGEFDELAPTPLALPCNPDSAIHIFWRIP